MGRYRPWILIAASLLGALFLPATALLAQSITGDILGTVQDASGAVVPGAKVVLTLSGTGVSFNAATDESGNYLFAQLKPGHYRLEVTKEGFQAQTVSDIELLVGQRPRVDVTLQLGAVTQAIEVSAGGVQLLEAHTASMGQVIQQQPIEELPLNGRNYVQLITLSAGVAPIGTGVSPASFWTGAGNGNVTSSVAGLRESNESFLVNGIETRNARFGSVGLRVSVSAIQEFKVETSNFSAETGRSSAVINLGIRSGTNAIHGEGYELIRNSSLDANDFFLNASNTPRPEFQQNNFGVNIGGPVVIPHVYNGHDRTFIFFNYEGLRKRKGLSSGTALLPSRAQLGGNLAEDSAGTGIFPTSSPFCQANPRSVKCKDVVNPFTGQLFPGNVIPQGMLNPISQKWLPFYPGPNVAVTPGLATTPAFNFTATPKELDDFNQGNVRLDHRLTDRDQIYGSYSIEQRPHGIPGTLPLQGKNFPFSDNLITVSEIHSFSHNIVNEVRGGWNRSKTFLVSEGALGPNFAKDVFGFTNTSGNSFDFGVPDAAISGFTGPGSFSESIGALDKDLQFVDNLSIVSGRHNFKTGMNYIHEKFDQITDFGGIPVFVFDGRFSGVGLGDFLLGIPFEARTSVGDSSQQLRANNYAAYFQDDWRVRPNFTVNLGLRWEFAQTPFDIAAKTQWFDPALGQTVNSRSGGVRNGIVDPDWKDFAPRVGFAYSPRFLPNTAIRAAYGVFYATDNFNELQFLVIGPDFFSTQTLDSDPTKPTLSLQTLFPAARLGGGTLNPFTIDKRNRTPYVQEWNFDFQHTFRKDWIIDVGYVGNVGQKLLQRRNQNIATIDPTGKIPINDRVPYKNFGFILDTYGGGWSSYNGLATRVEHRMASGFYVLGSYTWSHAIDLGGTDEFSAISRQFKTFDRGNSTFDVQHRAAISYLYELPFGRGKPFLSGVSGAMDKLVGGWKVNGITTFSTGQFKTVGLGFDFLNVGTFSQSRPDKIGPAFLPNGNIRNNVFVARSSFVVPGCPPSPTISVCATAVHREGNAARNSISMPGINNFDISIFKETRATERLKTEFRAEFFNAFNHTQLGDINLNLRSTAFGSISSLRIPTREIQLALKLIF